MNRLLEVENKRFTFVEKTAENPELLCQLRQFLHSRLVDSIEDDGVTGLSDREFVTQRLNELITELPAKHRALAELAGRDNLIKEIIEELKGMGPISGLMLEPGITDILINGPDDIWVDRNGFLTKTKVRFDNEAHLNRFLDRILAPQGKQLDARRPLVDARLPDGSRLHAVIPPLSTLGTVVSIRRFHRDRVNRESMLRGGFLTEEMLQFLQLAVKGGINIVIAGGAGSGKTSLLNIISEAIPAAERIITIEETAELDLQHPHVVPLEARENSMDREGSVSLRDLVRAALRMRANRIIVGEVRGGEVLDMLQAMNVGHDGSLTTVHANGPNDVINRLETLGQIGDSGLPPSTLRQMVYGAVQLIVQVTRFDDGSRRIVSIAELRVHENGHRVQELFQFAPDRRKSKEAITGRHIITATDSNVVAALARKGLDVSILGGLYSGAVA